jgi:hypothetical protein
MLFNCDNGSTDATFGLIGFLSGDTLTFGAYNQGWRTTTQVFRDPSAWYHFVVAFDTTQATPSNRVKIYVNGAQISNFGTTNDPTLSTDYAINQSAVHNLAKTYGGYGYFDGYLAEVNFIDGQALDPTSFGAYDTTTGVWGPKKYTGTYGTNGFYLNFSDNSGATSTTIGKDSSGNGNNWTPNNISLASGTTYDSMIDSPTNYADGGNGRGNYAVLNPNDKEGYTVSDGNLRYSANATSDYEIRSTMSMSSGKWYWEVVATQVDVSPNNQRCQIGIMLANTTFPAYFGAASYTYSYYSQTGNKFNNSVSTAYGATYGTGDIIGVAFDATNGTLTYYKNGTSQGVAFTGIPAGDWCAGAGIVVSGTTIDFNFGQRPFAYTPPSGFLALNTQNLPTPTIAAGNKYFDATTYTGNGGGGQGVVNSGSFQPDFIWVKSRSAVDNHQLVDVVRGLSGTPGLSSNLTNSEFATGIVQSFNPNGFTTATGTTNTYIGWQWKAGGTAVPNNTGSIPSQVSANTSAGFSVVTYTGTGANATVGHGLGVAPVMILNKARNAAYNWHVYFSLLGTGGFEGLNTTAAYSSASNWFNNASVNSTTFPVGASQGTSNYVCYCFAPVAGYSAFGSYTGNGSTDGPMIFTGFRPRWILAKRTDTTSDWRIHDTSRATYNVDTIALMPNLSSAEDTGSNNIDVLSNGFKMRDAGGFNISNGTYIYAAFCELPFKTSRAR